MRIPAKAASDEPKAQLKVPIQAGRAPFRAARSRLSTTARMAMPMRVR